MLEKRSALAKRLLVRSAAKVGFEPILQVFRSVAKGWFGD